MSILSRHITEERQNIAVAKQRQAVLFDELTPIVERALQLFMKAYYGVQRPEVRINRTALLWSNALHNVRDDSVSVTFRESPDRFTVTINWFPNAQQGNFKPESVSHTVYGETRDHLETCLIEIAQKRGLKVL